MPHLKRKLGRSAKRTAARAARRIYGGGVAIEVEIEEGSLRTRITVISVALNILHGAGWIYSSVADLKGFQEGAAQLCDYAREFAVDVCNPFLAKAGVSKEEVYRFERRLKTPGRLYRFSKQLRKLEGSVDDLSPSSVKKELGRLRAELDLIESDLSAKDRKAIEKHLNPLKLPSPSNWPRGETPRVVVRSKDEELLLFEEEPALESIDHRRVLFREREIVPIDPQRGFSLPVSTSLSFPTYPSSRLK